MKNKLENIAIIIVGFYLGILWLIAYALQWFFQMIADFFDSAKEFLSKMGDTK